MTFKHNSVTHKTWANTGSIGLSPASLMAKLRNLVKLEIPVGYQDETGFHYGVKSAAKGAK
jgi:hypothetical protein